MGAKIVDLSRDDATFSREREAGNAEIKTRGDICKFRRGIVCYGGHKTGGSVHARSDAQTENSEK